MYLIANMCARRAKKARVSEPTITTAVDNAPPTPVDASETTLDEDVSGLVERLHLTSNSAGDLAGRAASTSGTELLDGGPVMERAAALKAQGNAHFQAGDYHPALLRYSEAIEMLEGGGHDALEGGGHGGLGAGAVWPSARGDAALATLLCNRSVASLKSNRPGAALVDAERATVTLHPTPYTLHHTPYTTHPTLYTLLPTPYTVHPTPYTLHPA